MMKGINCPNCGAPYNPAKFVCDSCGSFVIMTDENQFNVPEKTREEIKQAASNPAETYPGTYVYGELLGAGEIPIRLGSASYFTSLLTNVGGKLLLTGSGLYFNSHGLNLGSKSLKIPLSDITKATYDQNKIVSDQISVFIGSTRHKFNVYGGKEWIEKIESAKANPAAFQPNTGAGGASDYTAELVKLKKLLDAGIITEEEFTIKKRMLLGI